MYHCCTPEGLVVLRDHTNRVYGVAATMYQREQGPWHFGRKLDSEDSGERSRKGRHGDPLVRGEGPGAIHRVTRPGAWPLRGHSCEGLQQGVGGSEELLDTSVKILASSNRSLHLYRPLPSALTLCTLVVCFTFLA
jgi:hypothetical protein